MARVLKWGAGYADQKLTPILEEVMSAEDVPFDRYPIFHLHQTHYVLAVCTVWFMFKPQLALLYSPRWLVDFTTAEGVEHLSMVNYFGVGIDAAIALDFHLVRSLTSLLS